MNKNNWHLIDDYYHNTIKFLQAPPALPGLLDVVFMAMQTITTLKQYTLILPENILAKIPQWHNDLNDLAHNGMCHLEDQQILQVDTSTPYGILTAYPVYATFYHMCVRQKTTRIHTNIEILSAISAIYSYWQEIQFEQGEIRKKTSAPYAASIDLRQLMRADDVCQKLTITHQTTCDDLIDNLISLRCDRQYGDYYDGIERLMRLIPKKKGGRNRSTNETNPKKTIRIRHLEPDPELYLSDPTITVVDIKSNDDTEIQYNSALITTSDSMHLPTADQSLRHRAWSKSIAKSNQQLQSKSVVSDIDLYFLLCETLALAKHESKYQFKQVSLKHELPLLLTVMLWLGRSIAECLTLTKLQTCPVHASDKLIYYITNTDSFIVPAITVKVKKLNLTQLSFLGWRDYANHLELSNPLSKSNVLTKTFMNFRTNKNKYFSSPIDVYTSELSHFNAWMRRNYNSHLTTMKMQKIMYNQVQRTTHSQLIAYHITGNGAQSAKTASHYLSMTKDSLEEAYKLSVVELKKRITPYFGYHTTTNNNFKPEDEATQSQMIGSALNLDTQKVVMLTDHLKHKIRTAKRLPPSPTRTINIHNHLTLYIVMMFYYLTGCRPVNDPIENIKHIDWHNNLIIISDKDNDDGYHTRTQPMPHILRNQLSYYIDYLPSLAITQPEMDGIVTKIISGIQDVPFLFFLAPGKIKQQKISIKSIAKMLPEYPLPPNTHRHFLYNQLSRLNVEPEFIAYFSGHWQNGSEPHGNFSCISPNIFYKKLTQALTVISHECGWSVIDGEWR